MMDTPLNGSPPRSTSPESSGPEEHGCQPQSEQAIYKLKPSIYTMV